jgi:DnaJ-class molecular chaperone
MVTIADNVTKCPKCGGTGREFDSGLPCLECGGKGVVEKEEAH